MGKKSMIFVPLVILHFITMNVYGQEKMEWKSKDKIGYVVCADTLQLSEDKWYVGCLGYHTKCMTIENSCYFFRFLPIGSGIWRWLIEIYRQENDHWRLVAEGKVYRTTSFITADFDSRNNKIIISTFNAEYDSSTKEMISLSKVEEIAELSLSDL